MSAPRPHMCDEDSGAVNAPRTFRVGDLPVASGLPGKSGQAAASCVVQCRSLSQEANTPTPILLLLSPSLPPPQRDSHHPLRASNSIPHFSLIHFPWTLTALTWLLSSALKRAESEPGQVGLVLLKANVTSGCEDFYYIGSFFFLTF